MKKKSWKDFVENDEKEADGAGELDAASLDGSQELPSFEEIASQNNVLQNLLSERDDLETQMSDAIGGGSFNSNQEDPRFAMGQIPDLATRRREEQEREERRQKSIDDLIRQKTQEREWLRDRDLKGRKRSEQLSNSDELNLRDQAREKLRLDKVAESTDEFFEKRDQVRNRIKEDSDLKNAPPRERLQKANEIKERFSTGLPDKTLGFRSDQKIDNPLGKLDKAKKKFDDFRDKFLDRGREKELKEKWDQVRDAKRKAKTLKDKFERKTKAALGNDAGGTAELDKRQQKALEELAQKKEQERIEEAKRKAKEAAEEAARDEIDKFQKRREANRKKREERRQQRREDRFNLSREERREKRQKERKEKGKAERREERRAQRREENKREQKREERRRKKKDRFS